MNWEIEGGTEAWQPASNTRTEAAAWQAAWELQPQRINMQARAIVNTCKRTNV